MPWWNQQKNNKIKAVSSSKNLSIQTFLSLCLLDSLFPGDLEEDWVREEKLFHLLHLRLPKLENKEKLNSMRERLVG